MANERQMMENQMMFDDDRQISAFDAEDAIAIKMMMAQRKGSDVSSGNSDDYSMSSGIESSSELFILDPSELFRPEHKSAEEYRTYTTNQDDYIQRRVYDTYRAMHKHQTFDFVRRKREYWTRFDKAEMDIMQALQKLNVLIDESDPDIDLPNMVHAFQTAERIRAVHPDRDWFHLTGLIHDLGKVMALYGEPQWAVVGDTFPVGCRFAESIVYRHESFDENEDLRDERYNTEYGIYEPRCGLKNVAMSWGHDEYMYQVLMNHERCSLPAESLFVIRFHSFYPWHTGGDYQHLCSDEDNAMLRWVREFNKFDLYSKTPDVPDVDALMPYYQGLIDKYLPGKVKW